MTEDTPNRHDVEPEDAQRLNRLSEEVRGRLAEIGLIITRITGSEPGGVSVQRFITREGAKSQAASATADWLEVVDIVPGLSCCYGSIGGQTILECPCGSA